MSAEGSDPKGAIINVSEELRAEVQPGKTALLTMGGVAVPVELSQEQTGDTIVLKMKAHGASVDWETYESTVARYSVKYAEGETYSPAVDLIRYPMRVGDSWDWSGSMVAAGQKRPAKALIQTSAAKLTLAEGPVPAVKVALRLSMPATATMPAAERTLSFWFVENRGLLRREFGTESIREPGAAP
jgi:hypothetical protein